MFCADDLFKIFEKINYNAYKLDLPPEFHVGPTFNIQIYDLTWEKKVRFHPGRCQFKRGSMMRTSLHQIQPPLLLKFRDQLQDHEHNNYVIR
jgi:hypothetical protein